VAVREFTDSAGRNWRAWNITPDSIHPVTKAEDYLADCYEVGWIVFETPDGREKRRLCPYPMRWADMSDAELQGLLTKASAVPPSKLARERQFVTGQTPPAGLPARDTAPTPAPLADVRDASAPDVTDLRVVRSFRYPGGRVWTVCVIPHPEGGGPPVLRFSAGARRVDLRTWPRDWPDYADERLIQLLRAVDRAPGSSTSPTPEAHRRYSDPSS
jgi:hypothetical protein